nr:copia protein [Tanacetum cinerariifolium]
MITYGGPKWLFDIDALLESMNYALVPAGTNSNDFAGKGAIFDASQSSLETGPSQDYILMPLWKDYIRLPNGCEECILYGTIEEEVFVSQPPCFVDLEFPDRVYKVEKALYGLHQAPRAYGHNKDKHGPSQESECDNQERPNAESSTKIVNTVGPVNTATPTYDDYPSDPLMPDLEDTGIFDDAYDDRDEGAEAEYNNLETVTQALDDESWVEAMQEELFQFKLLNVWTLVDLPHRKRAIGTKWVYRNKRDQRGIVVRNKVRLVAQGHRQEEGICYDKVFAPITRIEAIKLFMAYASFMDFIVYQIDVKSAFLYGIIEEETKIHVDNESAICVVKNPVYHSKTKHIEIRHHFIRDSYEKRLIEMVKIHTDYNVVDLLTKAFDVTRF